MKGTFDQLRQCWKVVIDKDIDVYNVSELKEAILACVEEKQAGVLLDASAMEYIDSTGLGALVSALNKVRQYGGSITICGLKPHIKRLFTITGLDGVFTLED
ncbi:MAG: STAS domain-containing protein [Eubacteriales bacterium]|nr:STAS domain-containing protein [Eubacteriales bacterium]